jgi:hypothetical protein
MRDFKRGAEMADVDTTGTYTVGTGNGEVKLAVIIGEGQIGTTRVRVSGIELVTATGPVTVTVGKAAAIKGKSVFVRTIVNDVNSLTNDMSVTYHFSGGPSPQLNVAKGKVTAEGRLLIFEGTFSLA